MSPQIKFPPPIVLFNSLVTKVKKLTETWTHKIPPESFTLNANLLTGLYVGKPSVQSAGQWNLETAIAVLRRIQKI